MKVAPAIGIEPIPADYKTAALPFMQHRMNIEYRLRNVEYRRMLNPVHFYILKSAVLNSKRILENLKVNGQRKIMEEIQDLFEAVFPTATN